jgi:hypothetical protein
LLLGWELFREQDHVEEVEGFGISDVEVVEFVEGAFVACDLEGYLEFDVVEVWDAFVEGAYHWVTVALDGDAFVEEQDEWVSVAEFDSVKLEAVGEVVEGYVE